MVVIAAAVVTIGATVVTTPPPVHEPVLHLKDKRKIVFKDN